MAKDRNRVEKRKFARFEVNIPVQCRPLSTERRRPGKELVFATIKNISTNGILLDWPGEIRPPQLLRLGIRILPSSKRIEYTAKTIWSKEVKTSEKDKGQVAGRYDVGLSFVKDGNRKAPRFISRDTNFYWQIFERTGYVEAYLLHKGVGKECEEVLKDEEDD